MPSANCRNGHPWTPENTYVHKGVKYCKTCRNERLRRHRSQFKVKECLLCNKPLPDRTYGTGLRWYCSTDCQATAYRQQRREHDLRTLLYGTCEVCGTGFLYARNYSKGKKTCGKDCFRELVGRRNKERKRSAA